MAAPPASTAPVADLRRERARASFPVRQMTHFLDGGEEQTARKVAAARGARGRRGRGAAGGGGEAHVTDVPRPERAGRGARGAGRCVLRGVLNTRPAVGAQERLIKLLDEEPLFDPRDRYFKTRTDRFVGCLAAHAGR
jgi:hypothetical protein